MDASGEKSHINTAEVSGINDLISNDEIKDFLKKMDTWHQENQKFLNKLKNLEIERSVVLVLGKTYTGKSTLLNGLTGVDLEYFEEDPIEMTEMIDCVSTESREKIEGRTKIGHSGESTTKAPVGLEDPNNLMIFYDCCGFEDTKGAGDEIQNILYLQTLVSTLRRVKVVLTIADHTITQDNKNEVFNEINQITRLFDNQDFLRSSLYLVVTKGRGKTKRNSIKHKLAKSAKDDRANLRNIREVVESLIENDRIGFFPRPEKFGPIERDIFQEIIRDLNQVPETIDVGQMKIEISAEAEKFVSRVFTKLQECVSHQLAKISEKVVNQVCSKKIEVANHINEVYEFIRKLLKEVPSNFAGVNNSASHSKDKILSEVKNYANKIIKIEALKEDCEELIKLVCYIEELLKISPEKIFDWTSWNDEVLDLQRRLGGLIKISDNLVGNTLTLKGVVIDTRYIERVVALRQKEQEIKRIEVYCLKKFFGNDNLTLQGIDLLIISPTWFISKEMEINLSGRDQQALPPQENHLDTDDSKKSDKDGKPGLPGGNSGNFICIGNEFINISQMKLILNGGRGGQGSEGKEGECGTPGIDGDFDPIKRRDTKCMTSKELCYSASSILCSMVTLNGKFNEVYESQGEAGEKGKDGGKGGCGGRGGRNGQVCLFIGRGQAEIEEQIVWEANDGPEGIAGVGGRGGAGGQGGKSYKATYFNEMVLPEFRDRNFWTSKSTSKRIFSAPRSASRGVLHAAILAAHIPVPVLLPVLTAIQLCVSSHAAIANSRWEQAPGESFKLEDTGESGQTPEEKNYFNVSDPEPNDFNGNMEKTELTKNFSKYCSETEIEMFKSLIKPIEL